MATFFRSIVRAGPSRLVPTLPRTPFPPHSAAAFSTAPTLFNPPYSSLPGQPASRSYRYSGMESTKKFPLESPINRDPLQPSDYTPAMSDSGNNDPDGWWAAQSSGSLASERKKTVLPGNQFSGRSFKVMSNDPMGRIRQLSSLLNRTGVKAYVRRSEYHERPSERKRRLGTARHRRRFQEMVREKVQTVQTIRNRG